MEERPTGTARGIILEIAALNGDGVAVQRIIAVLGANLTLDLVGSKTRLQTNLIQSQRVNTLIPDPMESKGKRNTIQVMAMNFLPSNLPPLKSRPFS